MSDSCPRWLRNVPKDWPVVLLRLLAKVESGHTPSRQHPEYWEPSECTYPWFTLADIWQLREGKQKYLGDTKEKVSARGLANSGARLLPAGTVVFSRTASVGFSGIMPKPMATTQDFANFVCGPRLAPSYLLWVLRGMVSEVEMLRRGSTHQTIYMPDIAQFRVPAPELHVQLAIADFLDRKTAAIDALIEKKERLIALLAEKRAALIHQAVTKGLDPNVPMKHTGIPTLPDAPRHWRLVRNKNVAREVARLSTTGEEELLSVSHITGVTGRAEKNVTMFMASSNVGYKLVRPGNLVINTLWAWMGALGVAKQHGIVSPAYGVYEFHDPHVEPEYMGYLYGTSAYVKEMTRFSKGVWTSRLRLYPEAFLSLSVPVPPVREQREILAYVHDQVGNTDQMLSKLSASILKLKEYRQSLITAAVTGQLPIEAS